MVVGCGGALRTAMYPLLFARYCLKIIYYKIMEKEPKIEEGESADECFIDDFEEFDHVKHDKELRERAAAEVRL